MKNRKELMQKGTIGVEIKVLQEREKISFSEGRGGDKYRFQTKI